MSAPSARLPVAAQQLPLFVLAAGMLVVATVLESRLAAAVSVLLCCVQLLRVAWWLAGRTA
jgi:hypothetical protein